VINAAFAWSPVSARGAPGDCSAADAGPVGDGVPGPPTEHAAAVSRAVTEKAEATRAWRVAAGGRQLLVEERA
jgi:hypothetical protein